MNANHETFMKLLERGKKSNQYEKILYDYVSKSVSIEEVIHSLQNFETTNIYLQQSIDEWLGYAELKKVYELCPKGQYIAILKEGAKNNGGTIWDRYYKIFVPTKNLRIVNITYDVVFAFPHCDYRAWKKENDALNNCLFSKSFTTSVDLALELSNALYGERHLIHAE